VFNGYVFASPAIVCSVGAAVLFEAPKGLQNGFCAPAESLKTHTRWPKEVGC
jgi:hypothetical protein